MNAKSRVLMIDNAKLMHSVVKARLASDGVEFISAYDGEKGLVLARQIKPDVILLDVEMPSPDGFEVCRRLKSDPVVSHIPVIFLTALTSTEEKVRGLNLGAIDYVTKPFDAAELQARVRVSLRNKELVDLLSKKAMIDGLTGLWNRSYFDQRLGEELAYVSRHRRPLACVMIDVDHFKAVNDRHGHGFGDHVLRGVSALVQDSSRTEDVVCRYGGEEFAILARETNSAAAAILAERIRRAVAAATFNRGDISVTTTCSLGVADSFAGDDSLVGRADAALYESKNNGRNRLTISGTDEIRAMPGIGGKEAPHRPGDSVGMARGADPESAG